MPSVYGIYMKPLSSLSPICDGCGAQFTTTHTTDCKKGGLVSLRYNEVHNLLCGLSFVAWSIMLLKTNCSEAITQPL